MPTFEDVWRSVRLQAPDVPAMTARKFVADVYLQLSARRGWTYLRKETTLQVGLARSIVIGVTAASTLITSAALFVAGDVGRQLRIGTGDTFTIATFTDASNAILDRAYTGTTAATATAVINDAYYVAPADFARFDTIVDLTQQRRLSWETSQDELNRIDPARSNSGMPRLLSAITLSALGRMRYEWYPRPTSAANFPALYLARPATPADTDSLTGVLAERTDVLELGALARAARYPGTRDQPNAYFNLALARELAIQFEQAAVQIDLRDDDLQPQDYNTEQWGRYTAWDLAQNLVTLRSSDAGMGDYLW